MSASASLVVLAVTLRQSHRCFYIHAGPQLSTRLKNTLGVQYPTQGSSFRVVENIPSKSINQPERISNAFFVGLSPSLPPPPPPTLKPERRCFLLGSQLTLKSTARPNPQVVFKISVPPVHIGVDLKNTLKPQAHTHDI